MRQQISLSWVTRVAAWVRAQSPPLIPHHRSSWNRRVLTVVGLGLDGADAQVLTEERHGWVLALTTLAGHGAALSW